MPKKVITKKATKKVSDKIIAEPEPAVEPSYPFFRKTNAQMPWNAPIGMLAFKSKKYTKQEVKDLIRIQQERFAGQNLIFMPSLELKRGWRSIKSFKSSTDFEIDFYGEECNEIYDFVIYLWKQNPNTAGGIHYEHNDCLYYAIIESINKDEIKNSWRAPWKFKRGLKLERDDLIDISLMPLIETALEININVTGDFSFVSAMRWQKTANLTLLKGHYSYNKKSKSNDLIKSIPFKKQHIIFYHKNKNDVVLCDETNKWTITHDEWFVLNKHNLFGENCYHCAASRDNIETDYTKFIEDIEKLKEATNGLVDLETCGANPKLAVLKLFHNMSKGLEEPEAFDEIEEQWHIDAFTGALIFGAKEEMKLENATCYDLNSAYMTVLKQSHFRIPIKQGSFTQLEEIPEIVGTGIYHCNIQKSGDRDIDKLFRFNYKNKYCTPDIRSARKLGLKIELIQNDQANALLYGAGTCVNGNKMFGTIVDYLYDLKKNKVPLAKSLCLNIWGSFCEHRLFNKVVHNTSEVFVLPANTNVMDIKPNLNSDHFKYAYNGSYFKFAYARFACFLTGSIRNLMMNAMYETRANVFKCHTDSILATVDMPHLKIGKELGMWKIEHEKGTCIVKNSHNKPIWLD